MKNIYAAYFSGTGTTKKTVNFIAEKLSEKLSLLKKEFDFTLPEIRKEGKSFEKEDIVIFGVPVIAGRVPNVLLKYLETVKGNGALAVPVVLFGNRDFNDALMELSEILLANGFKTIAAGAFVGEHSFSKILAAGRPDKEDMKIMEKFSNEIYKKVTDKNFDKNIPVKITHGEKPFTYYKPKDAEGNHIDIRKVIPKTDMKLCDNCKVCAKVCPMGSIDYNNPEIITGICIKCCACIKKCHTGAKYFDDEGYLYHKQDLESKYKRRAEPELFY